MIFVALAAREIFLDVAVVVVDDVVEPDRPAVSVVVVVFVVVVVVVVFVAVVVQAAVAGY